MMRSLKTALLLIGLLVLAAAESLITLNVQLVGQARVKVGNADSKIRILETANRFVPFNASTYLELGRVHFRLGVDRLADPALRESHFRKSFDNLTRSLRLNPGFYQTHFYLAQLLMYMNYTSPQTLDSSAEFRKAAVLNSFDKEAYFEIGKILLSLWSELTPENRSYTIRVLKKVNRWAEPEKVRSLFPIWAFQNLDVEVIRQILPDDEKIYRQFADFLGQMSLSLEERHRFLVQAERMAFDKARELMRRGKQNARLGRFREARDDFESCLDELAGIRFFQNLTQDPVIDVKEYDELKKESCFELIRSFINGKADFDQIRDWLWVYLDLESDSSRLDAVEELLVRKKVIGKDLESSLADAGLLEMRMKIDYVRHRYRDIANFGPRLRASMYMVDGSNRHRYFNIFQMVGESFLKLGMIYDAGEFIDRAAAIEPGDPLINLGKLAHAERLNEEEEAAETRNKLNEILTPPEMPIPDPFLTRGRPLEVRLCLEGTQIELSLHFGAFTPDNPPLIDVVINGRVIVDEYLKERSLTIILSPVTGNNLLRVTAVNASAQLERISYIPSASSEVIR